MGIAPHFISALGTPLTESDDLDEPALEAHLADQWADGISGVLVAGSMGMMPLLTDQTYCRLIRRTVELTRGEAEVLAGAGDCSFARTIERVRFLNGLKVDGVVILAPFFMQFSQSELTDYFTALADAAKAPLYLYDLPQRTRTKIEFETVVRLAKHRNIRGIKCSDEPSYARRLIEELGDGFRVIVAQPRLIDLLLRAGFHEHVDGLYGLAPAWVCELGRCVAGGDDHAAAAIQKQLIALHLLLGEYGVMQAFGVILNARGIPGCYAPRPYRRIDREAAQRLLSEPVVIELIKSRRAAGAAERCPSK